MRFRSGVRVLALLAVSGCAHVPPTVAPKVPTAAAVVAPPPVFSGDRPCIETTHGCISTNPDVTQEMIGHTICVAGYTKSVRPATSYTNGVKRKLLREAGIDESHIGEYELDHLILLAVGGHPRKLSNLQLQPWGGEQGALRKDQLERRLQIKVCRGEMGLLEAQKCIAEDWVGCAARVEHR
jgi:hypothetical protein